MRTHKFLFNNLATFFWYAFSECFIVNICYIEDIFSMNNPNFILTILTLYLTLYMYSLVSLLSGIYLC